MDGCVFYRAHIQCICSFNSGPRDSAVSAYNRTAAGMLSCPPVLPVVPYTLATGELSTRLRVSHMSRWPMLRCAPIRVVFYTSSRFSPKFFFKKHQKRTKKELKNTSVF
jgi:hypothetical protein